MAQEIAKNAIKDARLARTRKPEVEILRKPHKRTRSNRLSIHFNAIYMFKKLQFIHTVKGYG